MWFLGILLDVLTRFDFSRILRAGFNDLTTNRRVFTNFYSQRGRTIS